MNGEVCSKADECAAHEHLDRDGKGEGSWWPIDKNSGLCAACLADKIHAGLCSELGLNLNLDDLTFAVDYALTRR